MLQQFSWGHFLIAMVVLNAVWYFFVLSVFYRKEVMAFLGGGADGGLVVGKGKLRNSSPAAKNNDNERSTEVEVPNSLMGGSRLPDGVEVKSSSQVAFSGAGLDGRYEQVGFVADVLQELKVIFASLEKSDGGKPEFLRKVSLLKEDYSGVGGHPSIGAINGFIRESAPFHISVKELEDLWY